VMKLYDITTYVNAILENGQYQSGTTYSVHLEMVLMLSLVTALSLGLCVIGVKTLLNRVGNRCSKNLDSFYYKVSYKL